MAQAFEQPHEFQPKYNANEFLAHLKAQPRNKFPDEKTVQAGIKTGAFSQFDQRYIALLRETTDGCKVVALSEDVVQAFEEISFAWDKSDSKTGDKYHFLDVQNTRSLESVIIQFGDHILKKLPPEKHSFFEVMQYLGYFYDFMEKKGKEGNVFNRCLHLLREYIAAKYLAGNELQRRNILLGLGVFEEVYNVYQNQEFEKYSKYYEAFVESFKGLLSIYYFTTSISSAISLKKAQELLGEACVKGNIPEVFQLQVSDNGWREIANLFAEKIFLEPSNSFDHVIIPCSSQAVSQEKKPHFIMGARNRYTLGFLFSQNPELLTDKEMPQTVIPEEKKGQVLSSEEKDALENEINALFQKNDQKHLQKSGLMRLNNALNPHFIEIKYDYRGEVLGGAEFSSSLPLRTALGEHVYQILRTLVFSSVAPLVFTDYKTVRPLEEIIGDAVEEDTEGKGKNKPKAPTIPIAMMRYFPRQNRQIHLNPEKIKVTKESDGDKGNGLDDTRYVSPHTRLLPPGYTPGRKAFDKVKNFGGRLHLFAWIHEKTTGQHIWLPIDDGDYDYFLNLKKKWQEEDFPANEFEIRFQTGAFPTTEPTQVILANVGREHRKLMADLLNTETQ